MSSAITGAGGKKYHTLLAKQDSVQTKTATTLYTATQDCLVYIWKDWTSTGSPIIKINGTATTSNYSAKLESWVSFSYSDEDIEHHIEMCGTNFAKLYLNAGDYISFVSSSSDWAKVNYRVLI